MPREFNLVVVALPQILAGEGFIAQYAVGEAEAVA